MADVRWVKITVDMFDDEKIKLIQVMPEGDALLVVWIRLITLAGKCNSNGYIYMNEKMPYTEEMLATIFNKPTNIIRLALNTFEKLNMVEIDTNGIYLLNFEKHQNMEGLERIREQTRARVAKHREQKLLCNADVTPSNVTVTQQNRKEKNRLDKINNYGLINGKCLTELFEELIHKPTPQDLEQLNDAESKYGRDAIVKAIYQANENRVDRTGWIINTAEKIHKGE